MPSYEKVQESSQSTRRDLEVLSCPKARSDRLLLHMYAFSTRIVQHLRKQ